MANTGLFGQTMNFDTFVSTFLGKATDYDRAYGVQCVDLILLYIEKCITGKSAGFKGNAKEWWTNRNTSNWLKSNFDFITPTYKKDNEVQKGDIGVKTSGGGGNGHIFIIAGGNSLFGPPEGVLKAQIRYSNDVDTKQAEVETGSGSMRECSLDFKPKHIGIVNIYFTELKVTDYIRFFSTTYDYNCIRKAIVFPQKKDGSFRAVDYQNEEDEFVLSFEETDNTEVLDLREFADGDSVNKIHWKLSMNSDDFIVRQYGEEVEKRNTIIVDLTKVKTDKFRDKLDLIYEAAYLLGLAYLEDGISARFVVWDGLEYDITSFDFDDEAGLEKALLEVMCIKCETDSLMHLNYIIMQNSINLGQYPVLITMQDYESDIYDIINVEKDNLDRIFNIKDGAD